MIVTHAEQGAGMMHMLVRNLMATWFAAFAIAGATVWAAPEEEAGKPDVPPAANGPAADPAPSGNQAE